MPSGNLLERHSSWILILGELTDARALSFQQELSGNAEGFYAYGLLC